MKKFIICFAFAASLMACSSVPHIYIGDSEGDLVYHSNNRDLKVHWWHTDKYKVYPSDTLLVDSLAKR